MKNLKLLWSVSKTFAVENATALICDQITNGKIYFTSSTKVFEANLADGNVREIYEISEIVGCDYICLNDELCIATSEGNVVVYNVRSGESEEVTYCDGGILEMSRSPDQEVLVFVTKAKNVVVMNCNYDPILESSLDDTFFGDQEFITVGWGKKETQFHGSEGKQAAKKKEDFVAEDISQLDQSIRVSWRGDGALFTVSYVGSYGRMFKVFDREGRLQFTSEKFNGLQKLIAWRPCGTWIAVPHNFPNKYTIGLFEKNGLRHREVVLPFDYQSEPIRSLTWSSDSDILAVESQKGENSCLYLFTMGNYHWYLKQCLQFQAKIVDLVWDSGINDSKTLHVLLENGQYLVYRWDFEIKGSIGFSADNQALVAVIDGKKLLLTDFRNNIIPPPMSGFTLEKSSNINGTGFIRNSTEEFNENSFFTVDCNNSLCLYVVEFEKQPTRKYLRGVNLKKEIKIPENLLQWPFSLNHWLWLNSTTILCCQYHNAISSIHLIKLDKEEETFIIDSTEIQGEVGAITEVDNNRVVLHLSNGIVYEILFSNDKFEDPKLLYELPEFCENFQAVRIDSNDSYKIFFHKSRQNLYLNETQIATDVTSFQVTEKYALFTHLESIHFVRLTDDQIVDKRQIERGGKIVTTIPKDSKVILQMPRGNLEAIHPRILSLCIIVELLDALEYRKAMEILRKQRINLNILVDHNPNKFFSNLDHFLTEISNPNWLNLFITDLQNEDFSKTLHASNYSKDVSHYPEGYTIDDKVNTICEKLCQEMKSKDFNAYILPIITTYCKQNNIESALDIIWSLKKSDPENNLSEEALRYLLYLVDVNELYDIALGMYDFGLVVHVAQKSQKDPKEYIPFLVQLDELEDNYRKFKIDEHLKRYEKAIGHIAKCGNEKLDECMELIDKHKMYRIGIMAYEMNPEACQRICLAFADYLRSRGKHEDASFMYQRGGDLQQAITSAKHILDWQRCLYLTRQLYNGRQEEMEHISLSLISALQEKGRFEEAANLVKNHCNNISLAIDILLRGRLYVNALFDAKLYDESLIEAKIKQHLKDYAELLKSSIKQDEDQFVKFKNRLTVIRKIKATAKDTEDLMGDHLDESDLLSDTSSMNSSKYTRSSGSGSGKTFRSSKNRRKHERKLLSLKEGNPFEDIALIDALYNLIEKIMKSQQHIRDSNKALIEILCDRDARDIQKSFGALLNIVKDSLDEIWIPEMLAQSQVLFGPNIDYAQLQNDQHYAMIKPHQRFKPQLSFIDWEHEILK